MEIRLIASNQILRIIGRDSPLFQLDIEDCEKALSSAIESGSFLIIGGAGSIGKAVVKEIFSRNPLAIHVVDINENNLVELVREIRSSLGYIKGDFQTFAIDFGSIEFESLINSMNSNYDYVLNLAAMKHVRSERDPFTLMRMIDVNIINVMNSLSLVDNKKLKKYFCVSTDKATNPVNMMGASKRIMEMFLLSCQKMAPVSMARFANVAFSDGSLLHGFNQRFASKQPITAPNDVERYFITPQESGQLCLLSSIFGGDGEIFFPSSTQELKLTKFSDIAARYIEGMGYEPFECESEDMARSQSEKLISENKWPCYFFKSDTTGEKDFEEFYKITDSLNLDQFRNIGIIKNIDKYSTSDLRVFWRSVDDLKKSKSWSRHELITLFQNLIPEFSHRDTGKFLDQRM